jgi:hypothetical protein
MYFKSLFYAYTNRSSLVSYGLVMIGYTTISPFVIDTNALYYNPYISFYYPQNIDVSYEDY